MKEHSREALRIAGIYALASSLWILLSDIAVKLISTDQDVMVKLSIYKGWGFVLLTSVLLLLALRKRLALLGAARNKAVRAKDRIEEQMSSLSSLFDAAQTLAEGVDVETKADKVAEACVERLGVDLAWIGRLRKDGAVEPLSVRPRSMAGSWTSKVRWDDSPQGRGPAGEAVRTGKPVVVDDVRTWGAGDPWRSQSMSLGINAAVVFPLVTKGRTFGVLVVCSGDKGFFVEEKLRVFQALANLAAANFENSSLLDQTRRRLEHIQALHSIDLAISGSLKDSGAFDAALQGITQQLGVEAASILSYDPAMHRLRYEAGRGFSSDAAGREVSEDVGTFAQEAADRAEPLLIASSFEAPDDPRKDYLSREGFSCCAALPLTAKGRLLGALELFGRKPFDQDEEWNEFLTTLASQTAVAFDNRYLLRTLENSNAELVRAYDATIEALSLALELKDSDTNWHSKRVTDLALLVARQVGLEEPALVQLYRGALLHDIGKMGVPDSVLLKPGPLDEDEMAIMRQHPVYAQQLLSRIEYLQPAMDVPYCHHEKWDGTGYPRGLSGEDIPLAARIFAVVDVYDALTSDRPYRKAWTQEKALTEIRSQRGRQFDPRVVDAFFELHAASPGAFEFTEASRPARPDSL